MAQRAIPCLVMRGGTSKGLYFHANDLPQDRAARDRVLLAAMGSPDERQIDGMGGAHPLTSKVAVVGGATRDDADVDYLFLQVVVDAAEVRDNQNCGNILAGIGPFAVDQGLVPATEGETMVRIQMVNTGSIAVAHVRTAAGIVDYEGDARIDGVPGTAAPVTLDFVDVAGSACGALLPTGNVSDVIGGIEVTCIDNGMPVVVLSASDFGKSGSETPAALESDGQLKGRIEAIRLAAGPRMRLGDVANKTVPKMCLVAPPKHGGVIATRTFIPHRVHDSIGVLGAATIAAACLLPGSVAQRMSDLAATPGTHRLDVEHPTGFLTVELELGVARKEIRFLRTALLRTARKLMEGHVFVPESAWSGP
ncbi:MAG TPA: 4-oxalomesaconate tautomerase [Woeseiaceae bacterium]|nr:4-oxalomesaconate tautomerase [Woeseiaceae bacterium]